MMPESHILVIEPNLELQLQYVDALQQHGYAVYGAQTAQAARELLSQQHFDAVLCNARLDSDSGLSLLREHYIRFVKQATQVVVMSDYSGMGEVCEELGFYFFHCNPFCLDQLINFLNGLLQSSYSLAGD